MSPAIWVLGEALMDCVAQPDGSLKPLLGGSPFNLACAVALQGVDVGYLSPFSTDVFGQQLAAKLAVSEYASTADDVTAAANAMQEDDALHAASFCASPKAKLVMLIEPQEKLR